MGMIQQMTQREKDVCTIYSLERRIEQLVDSRDRVLKIAYSQTLGPGDEWDKVKKILEG